MNSEIAKIFSPKTKKQTLRAIFSPNPYSSTPFVYTFSGPDHNMNLVLRSSPKHAYHSKKY